jgi:hypothetical protein
MTFYFETPCSGIPLWLGAANGIVRVAIFHRQKAPFENIWESVSVGGEDVPTQCVTAAAATLLPR